MRHHTKTEQVYAPHAGLAFRETLAPPHTPVRSPPLTRKEGA